MSSGWLTQVISLKPWLTSIVRKNLNRGFKVVLLLKICCCIAVISATWAKVSKHIRLNFKYYKIVSVSLGPKRMAFSTPAKSSDENYIFFLTFFHLVNKPVLENNSMYSLKYPIHGFPLVMARATLSWKIFSSPEMKISN